LEVRSPASASLPLFSSAAYLFNDSPTMSVAAVLGDDTNTHSELNPQKPLATLSKSLVSSSRSHEAKPSSPNSLSNRFQATDPSTPASTLGQSTGGVNGSRDLQGLAQTALVQFVGSRQSISGGNKSTSGQGILTQTRIDDSGLAASPSVPVGVYSQSPVSGLFMFQTAPRSAQVEGDGDCGEIWMMVSYCQ
jgi:hypothetical protein